MSRFGRSEPLIPVEVLTRRVDQWGEPLPVAPVPARVEDAPVPSAPLTPEVPRQRRPIVHKPRPARRGGGADAPACASGDSRTHVPAIPAVTASAPSRPIPSPAVRRIAREVIGDALAAATAAMRGGR